MEHFPLIEILKTKVFENGPEISHWQISRLLVLKCLFLVIFHEKCRFLPFLGHF